MKILNNLTIKHLKSNKKRTIVTIIGIILSTALMVGIGLLFSTVRDNSVKMIIENNGDHHVVIELETSKLDFIAKNESVLKYKYKSSLGYSSYEGIENDFKPYIEILTATLEYLDDLKLIEGRLPNNENEIVIPKHLETNGEIKLNVGDKIILNVGKRVDNNNNPLYETPFVNSYDEEKDEYIKEEKLIEIEKKEYEIVGIIERDILEDYTNPGYNAFTVSSTSEMLTVYVNYKNVKDTYKNTEIIAKNLGNEEFANNLYYGITFNDSLLAFSGVSNYSNMIDAMSFIIIIILTLVSIACIIVIYNSFAISVMERKKQFGLFSSIGATKKQLRHTVFFEAFIVGIIGIPLGILSAYLGIGIVLMIVNKLLPNMFDFPLALTTYPLFIIIPITFMIITILVSAFLPARSASKVSPIEAIRLNDDIKIKSKKLKTPKIIKLFGVEGEIAYKNMKRNKKKYRITIISLFISIVLFVSFSSLLKYGLTSAYDFTELPKYEYSISLSSKNKQEIDNIVNKVLKVESIKKYSVIDQNYYFTDFNKNYYTDEILDIYTLSEQDISVNIISLDDKTYEEYKKQIGLNSNRPILINTYKYIDYTENSRKQRILSLYNKIDSLEIKTPDNKKVKKLENIYSTNILPFGIENTFLGVMTIIVDYDTFNELKINDNYSLNMFLLADNYDEFDKMLDKESKDNIVSDDVSIYVANIKKELQLLSNIVFVIKLLLYGFISLVTLIGVTSVINTINTSIALRKKEFAVLRSIGLTPSSFNKMMLFECLFFGLKSLLYGLPVSFIIIYLFHLSFNGIVTFDSLLIPYGSILIAIFGVFIVVLISMWYATIRIKKENILDAIREENI